jgi:hypothetical protein
MHDVPYVWLPVGVDEPVFAHLERQGIAWRSMATTATACSAPTEAPGEACCWRALSGASARWRAPTARMRAARGIVSDFTPLPCARPGVWSWHTYLQRCCPISWAGFDRGSRRATSTLGLALDSLRTRQIRPLLGRATLSFEHKELEAASQASTAPSLRRPRPRGLPDLAAVRDQGRSRPRQIVHDEAMGDALRNRFEGASSRTTSTWCAERVDPALCLEVIRTSGVRLPDVDYARLFRDGDADPRSIPLYLRSISLAPTVSPAGRSERRTWSLLRSAAWFHTIDLPDARALPACSNRACSARLDWPALGGARCLDVGTCDVSGRSRWSAVGHPR